MARLLQFLLLVAPIAVIYAQFGFNAQVPRIPVPSFSASIGGGGGPLPALHGSIGGDGGHISLDIPRIDEAVVKLFNDWKVTFHKTYATPGEESVRLMIFGMNLIKINAHNADPEKTFEMKANYFADMTEGEFSKILGSNVTELSASDLETTSEEEFKGAHGADTAGDIDYEKDPCIGPVEHQQTCGSCYAFSAAHVAAWHHCKKNGNKYVNFSKQQIVDCSARDNGCTNGYTKTASNYIATNGIAAEEDYPYVSKKDKCNGQTVRTAKLYKPITGTTRIEKNNEEAMKAALKEHGPLQVIVDGINLAFYSKGIISGKSCEHGTVNHAIVLVGYKSGGKKGYWRIKNHWGPEWGEGGYFNIEAFAPTNEGCLGVAGFPSYAY